MTDLRKAAEMALEALNQATGMCAERTSTRKDIDEAMEALRQALVQPELVNVPDGWKLVPIEPTDAMLSVPVNIDLRECVTPGSVTGLDAVGLFRAWEAMIAATPAPVSKPDDLLRQSEQEGWRWAKECEAEVKRLRTLLAKDEPFEYWSVADGWVTVEPEEVIDGRATRKMMLTAMKQTDPQYRDDPECMFAMGWEAGFNARTRGGNTALPSNPEQGCGECGVKASDGYALYCVKCVEPFFRKEQT